MARPAPFQKFTKDPADVLDYLLDWRKGEKPFLAEDEVILTSTWAAKTTAWVTTTDITIDSSTHTASTTTVWVSDGLVPATYYLTNHIVTDQGREKDETIQIILEEQ